MWIPKHPTLIRRMRDARVKQLVPACAPLAVSLVRQSGTRGGHQLTLKEKGKTRTVYVPRDLTEEVRSSIREHQRIRKLLQEITQLELARIRAHVDESRRRGARR
jgi:c-di-AMP phosphodiesterase-like protein